ncbi:MAG: hydrogenase formation protein HypD [Desulfovibrionaceae bacterium]|nr:hydrogenase formation protein HypD [Desulfovibrionaceae bacterium]
MDSQSYETCHVLLDRLLQILDGRSLRFMEVCGTHTVALFQSGLRSLLPKSITHLSGPGCPVCVTHDSELALCLTLAQEKTVHIASFGDLLRVPGPNRETLRHARAKGAKVSLVYSPLDALKLAQENPSELVCFLGIGFETTAPTVAATIVTAKERRVDNFCVLSLHKLVPPVLKALLEDPDSALDAFLLPGHVSTVLGLAPYAFLSRYRVPGVVAGFEPIDLLLALCMLAQMHRDGLFLVRNAYERAVRAEGNPKARELMDRVFTRTNGLWRGLGEIAESGLAIREEYARFDARARFGLTLQAVKPLAGCRCGDVLRGRIAPPDCPLFGTACTPKDPVGPCMVSTEGSCAAWFKYGGVL